MQAVRAAVGGEHQRREQLEPEALVQLRQVLGARAAVGVARVELVQLPEGAAHGVDVGDREEDHGGKVAALALGTLAHHLVAGGGGAAAAVDDQQRQLPRVRTAHRTDDRLVCGGPALPQAGERLRRAAKRRAVGRVTPCEHGHAPFGSEAA